MCTVRKTEQHKNFYILKKIILKTLADVSIPERKCQRSWLSKIPMLQAAFRFLDSAAVPAEDFSS